MGRQTGQAVRGRHGVQTQHRCILPRGAVPCLDARPVLLPRRGCPAQARGTDDAQPPRAARPDREPPPSARPARAAPRAAPPRHPDGCRVRVPERHRAARAGALAPRAGVHRRAAVRGPRASLPPRGGVHRLRQRPRVPLPPAGARSFRRAAGDRVQHPGAPARAARPVRGLPEPPVIEGLLLAAGSALLGGALALLARRRASLLELTRTFAFTAAAGVVAFHLLPEVLPALGPTALLWIAAGFVLPWLLEVGARALGPELLARRGIRGMRVAAEVGFAALLFHSLFEGLALLAALQGRDNRTDLEIAIVAHHAPLTAAVALPFLDLLGLRATLIRVGLVALAGVVGVVFGNLVPGLASGADAAALQRATAVVAGALLHVVADEIREQRFSSAAQRALDLFAAAAGLSLAGLGAFLDVRTTGGVLAFARIATALALGVAPALIASIAADALSRRHLLLHRLRAPFEGLFATAALLGWPTAAVRAALAGPPGGGGGGGWGGGPAGGPGRGRRPFWRGAARRAASVPARADRPVPEQLAAAPAATACAAFLLAIALALAFRSGVRGWF